jgi:hypothetical protein
MENTRFSTRIGQTGHMTSDQLIAEGRRLQRPCVFLRPKATGPVAAIWHERDDEEIDATGHRCWVTVDAGQIPGLSPSVKGYLSIFTNEENCEGGRVEVASSWPKRKGIQLYAHPSPVLPPIDAVFLRGDNTVGEWLRANNWERGWGYNGNFKDKQVAEAYQKTFTNEYPVYIESDIYATLGGWHLPFPDPDWQELIDEHLMVMTIRDSEPWVEAWRTTAGEFRVIQRIT